MSVIRFPLEQGRGGSWRPSEWNRLQSAFSQLAARGEAAEWAVGCTERGDPQFFVLGPAPEQECIVAVTRLGSAYVVEDGQGHVLSELSSLERIGDTVSRTAVRRLRARLITKATLAWCMVRETFEERVEPALAEPMEALTHIAPQLAALA